VICLRFGVVEPFFQDRHDAGRQLARRLEHRLNPSPAAVVLALPRGGVPVGYEVAKAFGLALDVLVVRKLGVPGHEELAMGAIASGDVQVLNQEVVDDLRDASDLIALALARERPELIRREKLYRGNRPAVPIEMRPVIVVDDGLATGSTMRAAVLAVRKRQVSSILVAVPVAPRDVCDRLQREADEVVCAFQPPHFRAVGNFYADFTQTSDEEVQRLLAASGE
jgi:putative phosphoribosyl transferase